jgi:acetolactate synthase-1/3 small subunit
VGVTDDKTVSRITLVVDNGNNVVEQIEKQLNKLIEVIKVRTLDERDMIGKELMIIKVSANQKTRKDIMNISDIMGAKVDDISNSTLTLELADSPDRMNCRKPARPFSSSRWPGPE